MDDYTQANEWAKEKGYETAEPITLRSGETVYLLQAKENEVIGLPQYVRITPFGPILSSYEESMALFEEPDYMKEV